MQKNILIISILFLLSCSNNSTTNKKENSLANCIPVNGVYVFIKSKPIAEYIFLGSIELKWYDKLTHLDEQNLQSTIKNITGIISFSDNLENTLTQVKQKYPTADGVVFDDDMSRCEVIKFKD